MLMRAMTTTVTSVFVYGTLKQGRPLDRPALSALRTAVQPASIVGSLYSLGPYPTVRLDGQGTVQGEVHTFASQDFGFVLELMDEIEGYNADDPRAGLYTRHVVEATLLIDKNSDNNASGEEATTAAAAATTTAVWVYEYNGIVNPSDRIGSGVWEPGM